MKLVSVLLPEPYLAALDGLVRDGFHSSRSEAVRCAVRDLIQVDAGILRGIRELKERNV